MMILQTQINQDGTLNIPIPKLLWGKKVIISITEESKSESSILDSHSPQLNTTGQPQSELKPEVDDETAYLLSSPANAQRLEQAKAEFDRGQWVEVDDLDELFK